VEESPDKVEEDVNAGVADDSQVVQREGAGEKIMPRKHKADIENDVRNLDRQGQRNLYLLLLEKDPTKQLWRFPQGTVEKGEVLHRVRLTFASIINCFD
jgi:large subunit ribosomal protein L46